ncbi:glycosyltransferase family 4 protein [Algiphilus sp. W345]|uniref:Glycosyltransferase family 4 protein n=1 Tax=Banduia mediterranea TaxID=3075609 RepID=A0ABU2WGP3_9GAMM|nr:glycosyltransferase family 4 protein [Algiphilus sp. W345]MDT0496441.1 glycosyltransferase family 4 protein [Algiphilus sp. W345]
MARINASCFSVRIFFLSGSLLPSMEASSVGVVRMCEALARCGHDVSLFARHNGVDDASAVLGRYGVETEFRLLLLGHAVTHQELGGRGSGFDKKIHYPLAVRRALKRLPAPDLLYGRHLYTMLLAALTLPKTPLVYELHEVRGNRGMRWAERWLFRHRSFLGATAVCESVIADYRRLYPDISDLDLFLARNGADVPCAKLQGAEVGGRPGARRCGYVGSLFPGKGMETVAALAARLTEIDFHVVGGSGADLADWRARTGALDNLIYHGFVDNARVPAYLAAMDVLLAPPRPVMRSVNGRKFGMWQAPLKIFQYMAAGKPIIASDLPHVREILQHRVTALLVPAEDMDAWATALRELEDPGLTERLKAAAHADLVQRFTWTEKAKAVTGYISQRSKRLAL